MPIPKFDVIIFGASSFVGQILCRYLIENFGTANAPGKRALRWAIAGRSKEKLDALLKELATDTQAVPVFVTTADDEAALSAMARQTRVVVSTVGPYALYGDTLVKVCANAGVDYCDLTGEAHWVRKMIEQHETAAIKSGARIVHCCGFDSIPSDLGSWYLQQQSMLHYGEPCVQIKMRVKAMRGAASGGTVASMLNIVREATKDPMLRREYANPYSLCIGDSVRPAPKPPRQHNVNGAEYDDNFGVWVAPFVMAAINTRIVLRSHALTSTPPAFGLRYDEGMMMGRGFAGRARAISFSAGLGAFLIGAAITPTRWLMEKTVLPAPGTGPSPEAQARGFWDYRFVGKTKDGRVLMVKVTGDRDPGYGSTGKMLGEAAACLALDVPKQSLSGGFWTPATAMAAPLLERLVAHAGVTFATIE